MHTIVHFGKGKIWTTLAKQGKTHQEDITCCDMHLAYVGRGLYVELAPRSIPLQIVDDTTTSQSVIIGEIKTDEEVKAFYQVHRLGLGVGIAKKPTPSASTQSATDLPRVEKELAESTVPKASISTLAKTPAKILSKSCKSDSPFSKEEVVNKIQKTEFNYLNQVWQTSPSELAKLPLSKYRPGNYYPIEENVTPSSIPENIDEHYSTDTEIYWLLEDHGLEVPTALQCHKSHNVVRPKHQMKQKRPTQPGFQIHTQRLGCYRRKYYFKCKEKNHQKTFNTLKACNVHHQIHHKTIFKCEICPKRFSIPSSFRVM